MCWDFLGEFFVLGVGFEDIGIKIGNEWVKFLGKILDVVIGKLLDNDKSLLCKISEFDNWGS